VGRPALLAAALAVATAAPLPVPRGFVTDTAGVLGPAVRARLTWLLEELRQRTGAEIAVLTVDTTAPLDDFTYAMEVAEAWKPGRKKDDTGVVVLLAVRDRRLRILVGYGLEGVLPDGLVGEIQDREMVPAFRAGRLDEGLERGVAELAARIAAAKGVTLTGAPAPRARPQPGLPGWVVLLLVVLIALAVMRARSPGRRLRRERDMPWVPGDWLPGGLPGGWSGGGGGFGGLGGGSGGFGGFGGGSFGGGGAGRSW
jgi:uncharacterized protein